MKKKPTLGVEGVLIFVILTFIWFNILPMFYSALGGETRAFLALVLGLATHLLIGKKALKLFK